MKLINEMSLGEVAAFVSSHLKSCGIEVVLSGGSCVTIYSENRYQSFDLDFIAVQGTQRRAITSALLNIGFVEHNRYFIHSETSYFIEFPSGPLAVGSEAVKEIAELSFSTGTLRLLSTTDCIKDRLAAYYYWQDRQCLEQAVLIATEHQVDLDEIERWSEQEGMIEEFRKVKYRFLDQ